MTATLRGVLGRLVAVWLLVLAAPFVSAQVCFDNLVASQNDGNVELTWTNLQSFTSIAVQVDGVLIDTLPGSATSMTIHSFPLPGSYSICLQGTVLLFPGCSFECLTIDLVVPGDTCEAPFVIDEKTEVVDITGAAADGVGGCGVDPSDTLDLYYEYVAEVTGTTKFSTKGSGFDTRLAAYSACPAVPANEIVCNDDLGGGNNQSEISVSTVAGQSVFLRFMVPPLTVVPGPGLLDTRCIDGFSCSNISGSVYALGWGPLATFDSFDLYENGVLVATFPGNVWSTTWSIPGPAATELCIVGKDAAGEEILCSRTCCYVEDPAGLDDFAVSLAPDLIDPVAEFSLSLGLGTIEELVAVVELSHPSVQDLRIELESPQGTTVRLFDRDPNFQDDFDFDEVVWATFSSVPVSGPGSLSEFVCQQAQGSWTVRIEDQTGASVGTAVGAFVGVAHQPTCCPAPSGLTCIPRIGSASAVLSWTDAASYTSKELFIDGVYFSPLGPAQETYTGFVPFNTTRTFTVRAYCGAGFSETSCTVTPQPVGNQFEHVIWAPESSTGAVDSSAALKAALTSLGESWVETVDLVTAASNFSFFNFVTPGDVIWVQLGTYPNNHVLTAEEGELIVEAIQRGIGVFVEGSDVFAFDPPTEFRRFDGVLDGIPGSTDDAVVAVQGLLAAPFFFPNDGIDVTGLDAPYLQDNEGDDRNDTLVPEAQDEPPSGIAYPLWEITTYNGTRTTGVYYATGPCHGDVVSQSWELGGYDGDVSVVVDRYLDVLTAISTAPRADFEAHPLGPLVTGFYNPEGVVLSSLNAPLQVVSSNSSYPAVSGDRLLRTGNTLPALLEISFRLPGTGSQGVVSWLEFSIVDADTLPVTYDVYDHDDVLVQSGSVTTAVGDYKRVRIAAPYITRVVVDLGVGIDRAAFDDLCFETPTRAEVPDLQATNIVAPTQTLNSQPLTLSFNVENNGDQSLSSGWSFRVEEINVGLGTTSTVLVQQFPQALFVGDSIPWEVTINAPDYDPAQTVVQYRVTLDHLDSVEELRNESNNTVTSTDVTLIELQFADLTVPNVSEPLATFMAGDTVSLSFTVTNAGGATTTIPSWSDLVLLSTDPALDINDATQNGDLCEFPTIDGGIVTNPFYLGPMLSYTQTVAVDLPLNAAGNYYVYVIADRGFCSSPGLVPELNEANNLARSPGSFTVQPLPDPDLDPAPFAVPTAASSGDTINIQWLTENVGMGDHLGAAWVDRIYVSLDNTPQIQPGDIQVARADRAAGPLDAGQGELTTASVTIATELSGSYYVKVAVDSNGWIIESDSSNNVAVSTGSLLVTQLLPIDLSVAPITTPTTAIVGLPVEVSWSVANLGGGPHVDEVWWDRVFLSSDALLDDDDLYLGGKVQVASSGAALSYSETMTVDLPDSLDVGTYFIIISIDEFDEVFESSEANNVSVSAAVTVQLPTTDLTVALLPPIPSTGYPGQLVTVYYRVTNSGDTTSTSSWLDVVSVGSGVGSVLHEGVLAMGQSYDAEVTFAVGEPGAASPDVIVQVDVFEEVLEVGPAGENNTATAPFVHTADGPDLRVTAVTLPGAATAGDAISLSYTVENNSMNPAPGPWSDLLVMGGVSIPLGSGEPLPAMGSYTATQLVEVPLAASGTVGFEVRADAFGELLEQDEDNNEFSGTIMVTAVPAPNLVVTALSAPTAATSGQDLVLDWTVQNNGTGSAATGGWSDRIYLSYDAKVDTNDIYLGERERAGALPNNASYSVSAATYEIPFGVNGSFFVLVEADGGDAVGETTEDDNTRASSQLLQIAIPQPADLAAKNVTTVEASAVCGESVTVQWNVENVDGPGVATADGTWTDSVYLSEDMILDSLDVRVASLATTDVLPANTLSALRSLDVTIPPVKPIPIGYHLLVLADVDDTIPEVPATNNLGASVGTVAISAQPVVVEMPPATATIEAEGFRLFELQALQGSALNLTVSDDQPALAAEMFVSFNQVPSEQLSEFVSNETGEVVIPATQTGTYYILVRTGALVSTTVGVEAATLQFSVTDVQPQRFGNIGQVTYRISGAQFTPLTTVHLVSEFGSTLYPKSTSWENAGRLRATFDIATPVGQHTLFAADGMAMAQFAGLVAEPAIDAYIELNPTPIAPLRDMYEVDITTTAKNAGNVDAQFLVLEHRTREEMADRLSSGASARSLFRHLPSEQVLVDVAVFRNISPGETVTLSTDLLIDQTEFELPGAINDVVFTDLAILSAATVLDVDEMRLIQQQHAADVRTAALSGGIQYEALIQNAAALASEGGWEEHWFLQLISGGFFELEEVADLVTETQSPANFGDGGKGPGPTANVSVTEDTCQATVSWDANVVDRVIESYQDEYWPQLTPDPIMTEVFVALTTLTQTRWSTVECTLADIVTSFDPNGKSGPGGFGAAQYVGPKTALPYRIDFQNLEGAAAPARLVRIEDQLSDIYDLTTVRFGDIQFGGTFVPVAPTESFAFNANYNSESTEGGVVQITATIDALNRTLTWELEALDANTLQPVVNGNLGFLPPEDGTGRGQGYVEFTIEAKATPPPDEDDIINRAKITFDQNPPEFTAEVANELDADVPTSQLVLQGANPFAFQGATQSDPLIQISWSGSDPVGGSGLKHYNVYAAIDGGSFFPIRTKTVDTEMSYLGNPGSMYEFYSVAVDNVGNVEAAPAIPDAIVTIDSAPGVAIQPVGVTVCPGDPVEIVVVATGEPPLSYQWSLDGMPIVGETAPVLLLSAAVAGDVGAYAVDITNAFGTTTSAPAFVDVVGPPGATITNGDQLSCNGTLVTFVAQATGNPPFGYQWYKDGALIAGAMLDTYSIAMPTASDVGSYHVAVTDGCGQSFSSVPAMLSFQGPPQVNSITGPTSVVCEGDPFTLTATVPPGQMAIYEWQKDSVPIPGATSLTYTVASAAASDSGLYSLAMVNACGFVSTALGPSVLVEPCGTEFVRGDCNVDGTVNIADAVRVLDFLFGSASGPGAIPVCFDACDGQDDGSVNIADAVALLSALFGMPPLPLAPPASCGLDPTPDDAIDCQSFAACP